ncbi:MAG TPA: hypothetical protein DCP67_11360 [Planctomycetaceae bacterium]|jgi:threonine dehydrogenase-like Zn-dependent dehydrogenase|nr:hypothetical protein [Rhodopirellula sp.]MCH2360626.1 alcohol dehydrogenase catalytic domain-containing protein [Pirellulales bacterium]HAL14400.1 hypothetical protein [Planctomycetaceae bacterium]HCP85134.1 hypothetical protein [Planctomycetaceae bacterium]|tara:strand:+ start:6446 stop:7540 length:1095 start_codon:yes stop_codon:yes gene_type:complete
MKSIAAFKGQQNPVLVDAISPEPLSSNQVRCETVLLGICGTDREILHSLTPGCPENDDFLVLGHECLARVVETANDVDGLSRGDLVVPAVRRPTGVDASVIQRRVDMMPWGCYVERGIVGEHGFSLPTWNDQPDYLFHVPEHIADVAVLAEPISVSEKAVREAEQIQAARLGDIWQQRPPRVLVTGLGPIAFAAVIACRSRDWPVTVYGRDPADSFRASLATEFDAKYLNQDDWNWDDADLDRDGFDLILECTGSDQVAIKTALALSSCGIMVWEGCSRTPESADHNLSLIMRNAILRNHVFLGTVNNAPQDMQSGVDFLVSLDDKYGHAIRKMITNRVTPENSLWHYQNREPQGIKTIVEYSV